MKKIVSLFLVTMMVLSFLCIPVFADETNTITVYVTASRYGEFLNDKEGNSVAMVPVFLSGQETYTLDDVFKTVHEERCETGLSGYETAMGDYGLYISKFWDDTSGNFTYQVNFGEEDVWGPTHEIEQGDAVEFCINRNLDLDTEIYTKFDKSRETVSPGETVEFVLLQGEYTAEGLSFSPCTDAVITINGETTENITDAAGKASLSFDACGEFVISAVKTKVLGEETVTAIEAPVCVVTVQEVVVPPADDPAENPSGGSEEDITVVTAEEQIKNIVEKYFTESIVNDGNFCWFIADFADYVAIESEDGPYFTEEQKQSCVDAIIALADASSSQGDLAKAIIALRALGYDAKLTYKKNRMAFDIVEKLTEMITEESAAAPYYEYTLPYVLIALQQGDDYAANETIDFLLVTALEKKSAWQDTSWGVDGAAPMLRALAPYCDANADVRTVVDETIDLILAYQGNDGSMGNAASTGLAMAGLAAVGINPEIVVKNEKSLIDGLMNQSNESFDGFLPVENSFATEQGLRGLLGWKLYHKNAMIYDFKDYPQNEAKATPEKRPTSSWGSSSTIISDKPEKEDSVETPTETDMPQGLLEKHKDVQILPVVFSEKTFNDVQNHENRKAIEELAARGIINGKTEEKYSPDESMTRAEFATIVVRALGLPEKKEKMFLDVSETDWYHTYVNTAYGYGIVNGVSETAFLPDGKITREEAATMIMRAAALCGMTVEKNEVSIRNTLAEFSDYVKAADWSKAALAFCFNEDILDKSVIEIVPKAVVTRAEIAQTLYNMLIGARLI